MTGEVQCKRGSEDGRLRQRIEKYQKRLDLNRSINRRVPFPERCGIIPVR
jgi:hypothetical protein